jgi:pentatricopeptide repeat protein
MRVKIDAVLYATMMNAAASVGYIEKAQLFLTEMEQKLIIPTEVNFNILIKACTKRKGKMELAFEYFEKMKGFGYEGDIFTFNSLIQICSKEGKIGKVMDLLKQMKTLEIAPTKVTFDLFIHAISMRQSKISNEKQIEKNIKKALLIFDEMKQQNITIGNSTLNVLLSVFTRSNKLDDSVKFFENFKNYQLTPDEISYSHLISMFTNNQKTFMGLKYFKQVCFYLN